MVGNTTLKLNSVLREFHALWPNMASDCVMLFMSVAEADLRGKPMSVSEAADSVGMTLAAASRNIMALETRRADKNADPLDLISTRPHPTQYRAKLIQLTPRGRNLYKKVDSILGG